MVRFVANRPTPIALAIVVATLIAFLSLGQFPSGSPARAAYSDQGTWGGTSTGSANAYAVTIPNYNAFRIGVPISFLANFGNTGPATITVSWQGGAVGTKNIYKLGSGGPQVLQGGEIQVGYVQMAYDGTEYILLSNQSSVIAGMLFDWTGPVAPAGFLMAAGQAVSRTAYNVLFTNTTIQESGTENSSTIITGLTGNGTTNLEAGYPVCGSGITAGTTVASIDSGTQIHISQAATLNGTESLVFAPNGCGDGSTTFNVFDGRGLATSGKDDMGGTAANRLTTAGSGVNGVQIGAGGGNQQQTIAQPQLPNVTIPIPAGQGSHSHGPSTSGFSFWQFNPDGTGEVGTTSGTNTTGFASTGAATLPAMVTASMNGGVTQTPLTTLSPTRVVYKIVKY